VQASIARFCRWAILLFVAIAGVLPGSGPRSAYAENLGPGGTARIIVGDGVVGPYRLLVSSAPEPAQVGTVTFVVRVSDPQSNEKERDAQITVELVHSETGEKLTGAVTHRDAGNPIDYAAHIQVDQPGVYNGVLRITGPAGPAEVSFTQQVVSPRRWSTVLWIGLPFAVGLALFGLWYARASHRQHAVS
jgi:hypothetical protein